MSTITYKQGEYSVLRFTDGVKTGSLWGPGVEGNWYAYRADINGGKALRFVTREDADAYLKAEVERTEMVEREVPLNA